MLLTLMYLQFKGVTVTTQISIKNNLKLRKKVGMAVIKRNKTKIVVMVIDTRRHPYIDFMKSSSDG